MRRRSPSCVRGHGCGLLLGPAAITGWMKEPLGFYSPALNRQALHWWGFVVFSEASWCSNAAEAQMETWVHKRVGRCVAGEGSPRTPMGCEEGTRGTIWSPSCWWQGMETSWEHLSFSSPTSRRLPAWLLPPAPPHCPEPLPWHPADALLEKCIWKIRGSCNCWPEAERIITGKGRTKRPGGAQLLPEILARVPDF